MASKLLVLIIVKTASLKKELTVPEILKSRRNHRIAFYILAALLALTVIVVMIFPPMAYSERIGLVLAMFLLVMFGLVTERGTVCMSSMLKEWFISHSSYVWRSVLFTIMCLALLYQARLRLALYEPIELESYVSNPLLLVLGSILMGFGFVFADGCFIGSLWKAGQGNTINMVGIIGLLMGIGASQIGAAMIGKPTNLAGSLIPNQLSSVINPVLFLIVLWTAGIVLLTVFRQKRYRY